MNEIDNPVVIVDGTPINSYNPEFNNHMITNRSIASSGYLSEVYGAREFRKYIYKNINGEVVKISPWLEYIANEEVVSIPPTAENVKIAGIIKPTETLRCQYDYIDPDGEPEGSSIYTWYYTRNLNVPYVMIPNYNSGSLLLNSNAFFDCYIKCSVQPVTNSGESAEIEYFSNAVGPVPYSYDYPIVQIGDMNA